MKALLLLASASLYAQADPCISSWYTEKSGSYARIYRTLADESTGNAVTTWSRGQGSQNQPTYVGVHRIESSADWVYIHTTGLAASHVMGPWYLNEAKTQIFPNYPSNQAVIYRIPRNPTIPTNRTATSLGSIGYFVDGVAQFDGQDSFSYSNSGGQDATPVNGLGRGDGYWTRDAYVNEGVTFDNAMAHQAGGNHHYHVNPPALRHVLGDSVDRNISANTYTENFNGRHSPIIGWVSDGYPIYGPYGYSNPEDPSSPVRRMIPGYQLRTDLANGALRASYPAWAVRFHGVGPALSGTQLGPRVNARIGGETYSLGRYMEDYDYMGDLGLTLGEDFDLNGQNTRFCVTPEFPGGTWAYFTCIDPDGVPVFPYNIGRQYFGAPTGGTVNAVTEDTTVHFLGGPNMEDRIETVRHDRDADEIVLTWSTVEGGTYQVESSPDLQAWTEEGAELSVEANQVTMTDIHDPGGNFFYRLTRISIASFDPRGFDSQPSTGGGGADNFVATFTGPPLPPANLIEDLRIGSPGIPATLVSRDSNFQLTVAFDATALPPGNHAVYVIFTPPARPRLTLTSTNRFSP